MAVVVDTVSLPSPVVEVHCHRVVVVIVILEDNLGVVAAAAAAVVAGMESLLAVEIVRDILPLVVRKDFDSQR